MTWLYPGTGGWERLPPPPEQRQAMREAGSRETEGSTLRWVYLWQKMINSAIERPWYLLQSNKIHVYQFVDTTDHSGWKSRYLRGEGAMSVRGTYKSSRKYKDTAHQNSKQSSASVGTHIVFATWHYLQYYYYQIPLYPQKIGGICLKASWP